MQLQGVMEEEGLVLPPERFQNVGQALPELTTELLSAHTTQSSEMQMKKELLQKLEDKLENLQVQLQTVSRDVSSAVRTVCLKEDLLAELGQECSELEGQVSTLVWERRGLQASLQRDKKEREVEEEVRASYGMKMQSHQSKTKLSEQFSSTQIELEALREKICSLKTKSRYLI